MKLTQSTMMESGLGGQFWFSAALNAKDAYNVTYKDQTCMTLSQWEMMYGSKKDISGFRAFRCLSYVHINNDRRGNGMHLPLAVKAIYLGFASDNNMS